MNLPFRDAFFQYRVVAVVDLFAIIHSSVIDDDDDSSGTSALLLADFRGQHKANPRPLTVVLDTFGERWQAHLDHSQTNPHAPSHLTSSAGEAETASSPKELRGGRGKHAIAPRLGRRRLRLALRPFRSLPPTAPPQTTLPGLAGVIFLRRRSALHTVLALAVPSKLASRPVARWTVGVVSSKHAVGACARVCQGEVCFASVWLRRLAVSCQRYVDCTDVLGSMLKTPKMRCVFSEATT